MKCINFNFVFFAFFFISMFVCCSSFGQLEQGTFVLKEHFGFHTSKTERNSFTNSNIYIDKSNSLDLNTSFGYLFKDQQELGIGFGIGRENYKYNNTSFNSNYDTHTKRYGVSVYYRRYILLVEKFHFFASPSIGYRYDVRENTEDNISSSLSDTKTNNIGAYLYTGFLYNPHPKLGLSINLVGAGLQYSSAKAKKENEYSSTTRSFSSNMYDYFGFGGLNLGIQLML